MKSYKKIFAVILALAMVITLMPQAQLFSVDAGAVTTKYEAEDSTCCDITNAKKIHTGTTNASGGKSVTMYMGQYIVYTVSVEKAGQYDVLINYAGAANPTGSNPKTVPIEVSAGNEAAVKYDLDFPNFYNTFLQKTVSLDLAAGTNTITIKNVSADATIFLNLDYISITETDGEIPTAGETTPEATTYDDPSQYPSAIGRHEAENAIEFVQGSASNPYKLENSSAYSNGQAIGNMNTWPNNGRSYCVTKVNADTAGTYKMTIAYGGGEAGHPCNIDTRINGGQWVSTLAEPTTSWNVVGTISLNVELTAGVNVIDVTGACNIYYSDMGWEWVNLDYFELEKVQDETTTEAPTYGPTPAIGIVEAEEAEYIGGIIGSNPSFSGGKYVEKMNNNINGDITKAKYLSYRVIADTAGKHKIKVYYATTSEDTRFAVQSNDDAWQYVHGKNTGSWATTAVKEVIVNLKEGENTIKITGSLDSGWIIMDKFEMNTTNEDITIDPEETTMSDEPEAGMVKKTAKELKQENLVSYRGRNMDVNDAVSFDFTNSGFEFVYTGKGSIRANITTTGTEKFAVNVDGTVTYYPFSSKTGNIYLATDLEEGTHTIKVYKTQEAMSGLAQLNYLMYDEEATLSQTETDYKFLVIGASSTCGNQMDPDTGAENGYLAFPSVVSRAYNATWQQISCSGRGCTQGTLGEDGWKFSQENQLAEMYTYQSWFRDKTTKFDAASYVPDVIITNFNNDFGKSALSQGYSADEVLERMMTFMSDLRKTYPNTYIVMSYGNYPNYDNDDKYSNYTIIEKYKEAVGNYKTTSGDENIDFVAFPDLVGGQSGHANADEHTYMSELLSEKIAEHLNVSNPLSATHFEVEDGTLNDIGTAGKVVQITTWASKFSDNGYVEGMNVNLNGTEIAADGSNVSYVSVPITAPKDGMYKIELNYGTGAAPTIGMRVNRNTWQKLSLVTTTDWAKIGQNSEVVAYLKKGDNVVDVTGSIDGSYVCLDRIDTEFVRNANPDETPTAPEVTTPEVTTTEIVTTEAPTTSEITTSEVTTQETSTTPDITTSEVATTETPTTSEITTTAPITEGTTAEIATTPKETVEETTTKVEPSTTKPAKVKVGKVKVKTAVKKKSAKKAIVTLKAVKGASGYQVYAATTKKFTKKTTVKLTSKKVKVTVKKLKPNKKYYYKVRAYKVVKGKKYYGSWTKIKTIKFKK